MNNKVLTVLFLVMWSVAVFMLTRAYFPRLQDVPVENTEHSSASSVQIDESIDIGIAEAEEVAPEIIFIKVPVPAPGEPVLPTDQEQQEVALQPESYRNIAKRFEWEFVFSNEDRGQDSLYFEVVDSLQVSTYSDSSGRRYIGYSKFQQQIENLVVNISPQVILQPTISKFGLFMLGGGSLLEVEKDPLSVPQRELSGRLALGLLVDEKYFYQVQGEVSHSIVSYGFNIGIKLGD
jgi:hypothetical protein